jgi:hypothetical protein
MIYLILGLILLVCQFLPVFIFKDKNKGFVYNLFFWIIFQSTVAVLTQLFGVFYFWVIFPINVLASLLIFLYCYKKIQWKNIKFDWVLIFIILVSVATLFQVHYNYTGKINYATDQSAGYHQVKNMNYPYPYYSDEWDTVALINYSTTNHSLPIVNPFDGNVYFNMAIPFFSFLAEINLLLGLSALYSFNFFTIFISTLIVVLCYLFLLKNGLGWKVSAISALSVLYITSSANLPGIWHLIPIHFGIIFSLIGFYFLLENKTKLALLAGLCVLLFYAPIIVFYVLAIFIYMFGKAKLQGKDIKKILWFSLFGVIILAVFGYFLFVLPFFYQKSANFINMILNRLYYKSFSGNLIPQYKIYYVLPFFTIIFFLSGIVDIFKKNKWIFSQLMLGIFFWFLYSFLTYRIIIDFERIVLFTSIIIIIISAFGLKKIFDYVDQKYSKYLASRYITFAFLGFFVVFIPFYTSVASWQNFVYVDATGQVKATVRSVANVYITKEDIDLFKDIKQKKFLSIPWKGLVLAVATNNYPLVVKEGIVSTGDAKNLSAFLQADCKNKLSLAKSYKLDYIYLYQFDCPEFEKISQSKEGLVLYKPKFK